jgi:hypothetical protein
MSAQYVLAYTGHHRAILKEIHKDGGVDINYSAVISFLVMFGQIQHKTKYTHSLQSRTTPAQGSITTENFSTDFLLHPDTPRTIADNWNDCQKQSSTKEINIDKDAAQ